MKKMIDRGLILALLGVLVASVVFDFGLTSGTMLPITGLLVVANLAWFWTRRKQLPASQLETLVKTNLKK